MKNKILVAGNIIVDYLYPITGYPERGQLTTIEDSTPHSSEEKAQPRLHTL